MITSFFFRSLTLPLCTLLIVSGLGLTASAQPKGKDGVDDVKGAIWAYELRHGDEKKPFERGQFRVYEKVIYKGKNKVGLVNAQSRTETKLIINGISEINGEATLKKVGEKPPVWEGILKRKNGKDFKMKVEFKDA